MRFCDAEIGEQQGSGFGLHRAAAVGMQGELAGGDIMLDDGTPSIRSLNFSPKAQIRFGPGTSRS